MKKEVIDGRSLHLKNCEFIKQILTIDNSNSKSEPNLLNWGNALGDPNTRQMNLLFLFHI